MKKLLLLIFISILTIQAFSQNNIPKRELRGVWVASVTNLDWPTSPNLTVEEQKKELINYFDRFKDAGINVIFFQIRTECDALYKSSIEPWSYWLTGQQGKAPSPMYDPLQFAIQEAHKRGMELHAWFNPYRAEKVVGYYPVANDHITKTHPEWILQVNNYKFLNPGLPEVEDYVIKVFMDVVRRYNIDGVHMDDYFYSYDPISTQDTATFHKYNRGFSNIDDWRRDNINRFVKDLDDSIKTVKPYLKVGISPFGIWKPGIPNGISGFDAYNTLYCDPIEWLQSKSVDYITPQLYWPFGGGQDYGTLMPWWADSAKANRRHMYVGQAAYKAYGWPPNEIPRQIRANRANSGCEGSVFFEAIDFIKNPKDFVDSLTYNYYSSPALTPLMDWKEKTPPNTPSNLRFEKNTESGKYALYWDKPSAATDGDTAVWYAVYRFDHAPGKSELNSGNNLIGVTGEPTLPGKFGKFINTGGNYFVVTALDHNSNESDMSNVYQVQTIPSAPSLLLPANNDNHQKDTVVVSWQGDEYSGSYHLQISTDSSFNNIWLEIPDLKSTEYSFTGLSAQQKYYWRVQALGFGGNSDFSNVYSFTTGFPKIPELALPKHATTGVTIPVILQWYKNEVAMSYRLQVAKNVSMAQDQIVIDTTVTDTSVVISNLDELTLYFWRVYASNEYGVSDWSETWGFKTDKFISVEDQKIKPKNFNLGQNYPNPFNPSTMIEYQLPKRSFVTITVYNVLGVEVKKLVNSEKPAGQYSVEFNGSNLSSGIYFYKIESGEFIETKKMLLLK